MHEIEEIFQPYLEVLNSFAQEFDLEIEKYRHGFSRWEFKGEHPKFGQASLGYNGEANIQKWWDHGGYGFSNKLYENEIYNLVSVTPKIISDELRKSLLDIYSWEK